MALTQIAKQLEAVQNHLVHVEGLKNRMYEFGVIGGGISGLSTCYYLQKAFPKSHITLHEGTNRIGGWIRTFEKDGFQFEGGPNSLRGGREGLETWRLVQELGLEDSVLLADEKESERRFITKQGKLHEVTLAYLLVNYPEILLEPFRASGPREETLGKFLTRRFGREFTYDVMDPMCNGIYGGGLQWLSAAACRPFSPWKKGEYHYGSIAAWFLVERGKEWWKKVTLPHDEDMQELENGFDIPPSVPYTFKGGLQTLTDQLLLAIEHPKEGIPVDVRTYSAPAAGSLQCGLNNAFFEIDNTLKTYDHLFLAIPPERALDLLPWDRPDDPLVQYYSTSMVQVWFGWDDEQKYESMKGFGYLIPARDGEMASGMMFHHNLFPQWGSSNQKRVCVMLGGEMVHEAWELTDKQSEAYSRDLIKRHLGVEIPENCVVNVAKLRNCIPHYVENHIDKLQTLRDFFGDNISIVGSGYHGVSVHNCILSANTSVELFVDGLNYETSPLVGNRCEILRGTDVFTEIPAGTLPAPWPPPRW